MINFHLKKKIIIQFDSVKTTTNKQPNRRWITKRTDLRYFNFVSVFRFCALYVKFFFFFVSCFSKAKFFFEFSTNTLSISHTQTHSFCLPMFFFLLHTFHNDLCKGKIPISKIIPENFLSNFFSPEKNLLNNNKWYNETSESSLIDDNIFSSFLSIKNSQKHSNVNQRIFEKKLN